MPFESFQKPALDCPHQKVARSDYPRIKKMYLDERRTLQAIGDHFGVSRERIRQILIQCGISVRSISEAHRIKYPINEQEAVRLYAEKQLPLYAVANELKTTHSRISSILAKHGITIRDNQKETITKNELHRLYVIEKKSQKEIGQMFGIRQSSVSKYVIRYGLQKKNKRRR